MIREFKKGQRYVVGGEKDDIEVGDTIRIIGEDRGYVDYYNERTEKCDMFNETSRFAESLEELPEKGKDLRLVFLLCALSAAFVLGMSSYLLDNL